MNRNQRTLFLTLIATFALMALLVTYTTRLMYKSSYSYIHEIGNDRTASVSADLESYLQNAKSVLWVAADTVDHMVEKGATSDEIAEYLSRETTHIESQFDKTYTDLYGYIGGEYIDGLGWTPPEGYDPTARDWYQTALTGDGQPVIATPYVDSQTGNVMVSVVKTLSNGNDVLGLDLTLSDVQELVEDVQIDGNGYCLILDNDGMVVAHHDEDKRGENYTESTDTTEYKFYENTMDVSRGNFNMKIGGKECTVFVHEVLDQWHLVIVIESSSLFGDTKNLLVVSIIINLVVFALISTVYIVGINSERKFNKRIEEMKEVEQKKDYEAKLLMLEKSAADTANKAKSDFLADMSHEIRTPINAVLGMNEMILREAQDEQIVEYASNIRSAGNTLLSIINNILDFSKIEDGKMTLVPVEFDVAELIGGLVNSINERARTKNLEFIVDLDESIPSKLYGDDVRLSQVIMNLLTNAVKYTESGSITLRVRRIGQKEGNVNLRFEVIDTGIGIKDEDMDKLFKSFERIEERRNRHIEGTGLGLSIVNKLLAMMNSQLNVNSKYGVGSSFGFDISLRIVKAEPIGNYEERRKINLKNQNDSEHIYAPKAKVLVVDDNGMNLKVATNFMKIFGIDPVTATSGKETIEILRTDKFDIVFLDHMMPVLDGIETLKILKEDHLIDDTKVIALTANAIAGAEEQYLAAGFDGYLSKPIVVKDIEKTLKKFLPPYLIEGTVIDNKATKTSAPLTVDKARNIGLNVTAAVEYSCGDEELYIELLTDYAKSCDEKCLSLASYLGSSDLANYRILIHSLKSSSRTIGADAVSAKAKELEDASARGDIEFVRGNHETFVADYKALSAKILG